MQSAAPQLMSPYTRNFLPAVEANKLYARIFRALSYLGIRL